MPALKSVPRRSAPQQQHHTWRVSVSSGRWPDSPWKSALVIAANLEDACRQMLEHCASPGLDLEVTAVERLPSGVITPSAPRTGRAVRAAALLLFLAAGLSAAPARAGDRDPASHRTGEPCDVHRLAGWSSSPDGGLAPIWSLVPGEWRWLLDPGLHSANRSPDDYREQHPYRWECVALDGKGK